jgi:hypothetical protein
VIGNKKKLNIEEFTFRMVQVLKDISDTFLGRIEKRIDVFAL